MMHETRIILKGISGIIEYITASFPVVNGCCWVSVVANTWNPIFFSPRRILGVLLTFSFYPLYRSERRRGGSFGRIQFRPVKLLSLREEASVNRFEGDQYRDWFQHVDSSLFPRILVRRSILPFMAHFVRKNRGQRLLARELFSHGSQLEKKFLSFSFLCSMFNFRITHTWFIYIFFWLFSTEKSMENIVYSLTIYILLFIKLPLRKFSTYITIHVIFFLKKINQLVAEIN